MQRSGGSKYETVAWSLIDEPELPMRQTMDEGELRELAASISAVGILEPLLLERRGQRYRVVVGHRRYLAARLAGLTEVPALVYSPGEVEACAAIAHENQYRENVNAAEQAVYFARLLSERCGDDVDRLCALVRHRREHVEARLLLLRGDAGVLEAVRRGTISMAVARELNRVSDPGTRAVYLDAAERGGASARLVQQWRIESERLAAMVQEQAGQETSTGGGATTVPATPSPMVCWFCGGDEEPHTLRFQWLHGHCMRALEGLIGRCSKS
jgi:ParB family chromosome partitioning protein